MEKLKLKPTLWRTCRALMNPTRLMMMRMVLKAGGQLCVRDFARSLDIPDAIASIYLRQLNSRGLLGVKRDQIKVFYNADTDRTLPDSAAIQKTLRKYFATNPAEGWEIELMTILRAFSHFNRLAILIRLAKGPARLSELNAAMGVCVKSVYHHLGFLHAAGLVVLEHRYHESGVYRLVRPNHPLARTLLDLTFADVENAVMYYNPGTGRGIDEATRHVLAKTREADGLMRDTWQMCGAMKPRKNNLTKKAIVALSDDEE